MLLNDALQQAGWIDPRPTAENWRSVLLARLQKLGWKRVVDDVRPLLESGADLDMLTLSNFMRSLERA